tara:strand:+ start:609 stop:869 length:261 start_codon:yes stop_codon:yes gene_type:complete
MSLIKSYLLNQMNNELFDPGIDNLPMPVDGFEPNPHLEMLMQREQLMEDIDAIVEEHSYYSNMSAEKAEDLVRVLCDAVCKNFPAQ